MNRGCLDRHFPAATGRGILTHEQHAREHGRSHQQSDRQPEGSFVSIVVNPILLICFGGIGVSPPRAFDG